MTHSLKKKKKNHIHILYSPSVYLCLKEAIFAPVSLRAPSLKAHFLPIGQRPEANQGAAPSACEMSTTHTPHPLAGVLDSI